MSLFFRFYKSVLLFYNLKSGFEVVLASCLQKDQNEKLNAFSDSINVVI